MTRSEIAEARLLESWRAYQEALVHAIEPLTVEQLGLKPVPGLRSVGEVAEHIVFARALWLGHALGEEAAELRDLEPFLRWNEPGDPPHTSAEVIQGLDMTWRHITSSLTRGSASDQIADDQVLGLQIIWGQMDHDLPHCGEISLLLGMQGLPGVEID